MKPTTAVNKRTTPIGTVSASGGCAISPTEQAIRERAYAIHESHADVSRSPSLDWLEAEQQLKAESGTATSNPSR